MLGPAQLRGHKRRKERSRQLSRQFHGREKNRTNIGKHYLQLGIGPGQRSDQEQVTAFDLGGLDI